MDPLALISDGIWLQFALVVALVGFGGSRLARYGDVIATRTGLGGSWIGLMLIATVTSLPELVTGMSAVILAHEPDIAVGALLGSCVFNLVILAILGVFMRGHSMFARVRPGHERAAAFGAVMVVIVAGGLILDRWAGAPSIAGVGLYTPLLLALYLLFMRSLFRFERDRRVAVDEEFPEDPETSLRRAVYGYWFAAIAVVAAGLWLPFVGKEMATALRVDATFIGTLFVAFATSLPEVVVTIAAVRIGSYNMAMGNLMGSNLFNILILVPEDLAFGGAPILSAVSPLHLISAASAVAMSGIAIAALLRPPRRRLWRVVDWAGVALAALYLINSWVLYIGSR
jgi:cation:H+ antiporter